MDLNHEDSAVTQIVQRGRLLTNRRSPFSNKLSDIEAELRNRRKQLIGSYVSVRELVLFESSLDDDVVADLSNYLALHTLPYWQHKTEEAERFCFRFYRLMIYALAGGKVRGECVDDILRLAEILVSNQEVFTIATKSMLPEDMVGELFDFIETSDQVFLASGNFPDGVLGSVCTLLGVLPDSYHGCDKEG